MSKRRRIGVAPGPSATTVALAALRAQLMDTTGQLAAMAANPAFVAQLAGDADAVAFARELARLGKDMTLVARMLAGKREPAKG